MPEDPKPSPAASTRDGSKLPGPFAVGDYAVKLRGFLRGRARVQVIGEVTGLRLAGKSAYFELRDARGALPCAMWRSEWDRLGLPAGAIRDGVEAVVEGGPDYYPGSATASPSFSFRCTGLRPAGEGDLLARLAELRRRLRAEGLFEPQKRLPRPALPRSIGIVTGRGSAAEADLLAALARRSWAGRAVFAHPPVQDRRAAPRIARALSDLVAVPEVEVIVVARGGGSLADLWAFCDE
ncbi:MAG: exodeoxyribonuclease VII large subunit, partial [Thermoleophilia bacterium]|nr:exodeoxyribonuclease VII large subunit [Thermoleophilia bacterium]